MRIDFLENAGGRMGTEILDVEAVLPFSINGLDLPAAMVKIDEFGVGKGLRIEQRCD